MESMLIDVFISRNILKEEEIIVSTRTKEKLKGLKEKFSKINIEKIFAGKVTKMTPIMLSEVGEGVTLICYNSKVKEGDIKFVEGLFKNRVKRIKEEDFPFDVELTSFAPGFFASIFNEFMNSALRHNISLYYIWNC